MSRCTTANHDALKADHSKWFALKHIGYQQTETDDGDVAWLDCRNCDLCHSTLAVLVLMRDGQEKAA